MDVPDAYDLWEARDREQADAEDKLPQCEICGDTILDEFFFEIKNMIHCEYCMNKRFRRPVDAIF